MVSHKPEAILRKEIDKHFQLKEESIGPPSQYLGGKLCQVAMENRQECWAFGSTYYVRAAVDNVKEYLSNKGKKLAVKSLTPLTSNYRPDINITEELGEDESSYYQSLIGVLRWIVELGQVDIFCKVSMLSSHLALPRCGHLSQVLHMFAYLKSHANSEMVYEPSGV